MNSVWFVRLRTNWLLVLVSVVLLLFLGVSAWRALRPSTDADGLRAEATGRHSAPRNVVPARRQEDLRAILKRDPGPQRPDQQEQLLATIASHQAAYDADPDAPEAPAYLRAIGNLQLQRLQDYESAALNFEQIILNYPEYQQDSYIYADLITCYEMLGYDAELIRVAELMLERFPENSEAYLFALDKLELWDGEFPEVVVEEMDEGEEGMEDDESEVTDRVQLKPLE